MLASVKQFLDALRQPAPAVDGTPASIHVAIAVLLVEVSKADFQFSDIERTALQHSLARTLGLPESGAAELLEIATSEQAVATSIQHYTRRIVDHFDEGQKSALMTELWTVAYADGHLDPNEEYILRKIADLLYLPHSEYIRTKLAVQAQLQSND